MFSIYTDLPLWEDLGSCRQSFHPFIQPAPDPIPTHTSWLQGWEGYMCRPPKMGRKRCEPDTLQYLGPVPAQICRCTRMGVGRSCKGAGRGVIYNQRRRAGVGLEGTAPKMSVFFPTWRNRGNRQIRDLRPGRWGRVLSRISILYLSGVLLFLPPFLQLAYCFVLL